MPQDQKKKSNKLRNYLLGASAAGLTGLGAYALLRKKGAAKLIANNPSTVAVEKLAKKFDLPKTDVVKEVENIATKSDEIAPKKLKRTRPKPEPTEPTPDDFKPQPLRHKEVKKPETQPDRRTRRRSGRKTRKRTTTQPADVTPNVVTPQPATKPQKQTAQGRRKKKPRRPLDANLEQGGALTKRSSSSLSTVSPEIGGDIVRKTRRPLDVNLEPAGELGKPVTASAEKRLVKRLRAVRQKSNINSGRRMRGKRPLRDGIQKQTAVLDNTRHQGRLTGVETKGNLPPAKPKLNDVVSQNVNIEPRGELVKRLRKVRSKSNVNSGRKMRGKKPLHKRQIDRMQKQTAVIDNTKPQGLLSGIETKGKLPPARPNVGEAIPKSPPRVEPSGALAKRTKTRTGKPRKASNVRSATKAHGKRPLHQRQIDKMQKQIAVIDDTKPQGLLKGEQIKGKLPPASPEIGDVIPPKKPTQTPNIPSQQPLEQKLLPPAQLEPTLPKRGMRVKVAPNNRGLKLSQVLPPQVNKQLTRVRVRPFYRNGKLVQSYNRNMLTNIREIELKRMRQEQVTNLIQDLKKQQIGLNDPKLKENLQQQLDELNAYLTEISYDIPPQPRLQKSKRQRIRVTKPKPTPPNPSEVTAKQIDASEIFDRNENVRIANDSLDEIKDTLLTTDETGVNISAVHIKKVNQDIDAISQAEREKAHELAQATRTKKQNQIAFQPEKRSQILESLKEKVRATKNFAIKLDEQVSKRLNRRKTIETTYKEIVDSLKDITIPSFDRELNTVVNDVKISKFQEDFEKYLDDPFSEINHFDNVAEIKTIRDQIDSDISWANFQLTSVRERRKKLQNGIKRVQKLRELYAKNLEEVTRLNSNELEGINLDLDSILQDLAGLDVDDVGEEFFKEQLPAIRKSFEALRNGESQTYSSSFLKRLNAHEAKLKKLDENFDTRIKSKEYKALKGYIERLNQQKLKLRELPLNRRYLTREQKVRLAKTNAKRKEFETIFEQFEKTKNEYAKWRDNFESSFNSVENKIEKTCSYVEGSGILNDHMLAVRYYRKQVIDYFNSSKEQLQMLDRLFNPQSYLVYFDSELLKNSENNPFTTLTKLMAKKRDLVKGGGVVNGKFVKRPSLFKQLEGYDRRKRIVKKNEAGEVIKERFETEHVFGSLEFLERSIEKTKPKKAVTVLDESFSRIDEHIKTLKENISTVERLKKQYIVKQTEILEKLESDYENAIAVKPEYKEILDEKLESLKSSIKADVEFYDQYLRVAQLKAENAVETLKSYKNIRPTFNIVRTSKVMGMKDLMDDIEDVKVGISKVEPNLNLPALTPADNVGIQSTARQNARNIAQNDTFYDYELVSEIDPYTVKVVPEGIPDENVDYDKFKKHKKINTVDVEEWITSAKQKIREYKTKKRNRVADLYWDMQNNKIKTEGEGNIFQHIREGKLTEIEQQYYDAISPGYREILEEYSKSGLEPLFQEFYYKNTVRKYLLNLQTRDINLLPQNVQKEIAQKNSKNILEKAVDVLNKVMNVDPVKTNKHAGMIGRKRKETFDLIDKINEILKSQNLYQADDVVNGLVKTGENVEFKAVKATGYMPFQDHHIYLNGRLRLENLPHLIANPTSNQEKYLNHLLRKLHKTMGITEDGMPLVDESMVKILSGKNVTSFDQLQELIKLINEKLYDEASLNTLLTANRENFDDLRDVSANLYLYNFSQNFDNVANFSRLT